MNCADQLCFVSFSGMNPRLFHGNFWWSYIFVEGEKKVKNKTNFIINVGAFFSRNPCPSEAAFLPEIPPQTILEICRPKIHPKGPAREGFSPTTTHKKAIILIVKPDPLPHADGDYGDEKGALQTRPNVLRNQLSVKKG